MLHTDSDITTFKLTMSNRKGNMSVPWLLPIYNRLHDVLNLIFGVTLCHLCSIFNWFPLTMMYVFILLDLGYNYMYYLQYISLYIVIANTFHDFTHSCLLEMLAHLNTFWVGLWANLMFFFFFCKNDSFVLYKVYIYISCI